MLGGSASALLLRRKVFGSLVEISTSAPIDSGPSLGLSFLNGASLSLTGHPREAAADFLHVERAELARLTGDEALRERELREAHRLFTEIGAPIRAAEVAKELGLAIAL